MFAPLVECSYVAEQGPHPWATFGMALGLAIVWPLGGLWLGSWPGPSAGSWLALAWPLADFWPNPWPGPCPGPWLALCLGYAWIYSTRYLVGYIWPDIAGWIYGDGRIDPAGYLAGYIEPEMIGQISPATYIFSQNCPANYIRSSISG